MKKILKFVMLAFCAALPLCCTTPEVTTELNVTTTELTFGKEGGTQNVSFTTNSDWRASCVESWVKMKGTGTSTETSLAVTVDANSGYDDRSATLTISVDGIKKSVAIKQSANLGLTVSPSSFTLSNEAQSIEVEVSCNVEYEIAIDESAKSWITLKDTKALSTSTVAFSVAANGGEDDRSGKITIREKGGNLSGEVTVKQGRALNNFDETKIVCSLGMISDTHINQYNSQSCQDKLASAFSQLKSRALKHDTDGIDGVCVVGDLIDYGGSLDVQLPIFKNIYEAAFDPEETPLVYTIGNHDPNTNYWWDTAVYTFAKTMRNAFGSTYETTDKEVSMRDSYECRHCVVGGYHILAVTPNSVQPVAYPAEVKTWLDNTLKEITDADPAHYVIVLTHPMIYDTVYGSKLGPDWLNGSCTDNWYTKDLTSILSKYPQVMTFGGHLHFPINDPGSIWQGEFTSFGCGSTRYMAIEDGKYESMSSATVMKDCADVSSGLLLQFDENGNARITKMFFSQNTTFGEPWELEHPSAKGHNLTKYSTSARKSANTAPTLSTLEVAKSGASYMAKFAKGSDDEFVHHYVLTIKKDGEVVMTKNILSDYYRNADPAQMRSTWEVALGQLDLGDFEASLVAYDSWWAKSEPLVTEFSTDGKRTWALNAKKFDQTSGSKEITESYAAPLIVKDYVGENGNNVLIKGLFYDAEVEGKVEKDGDKITKIGVYLSSKRLYKADDTRYCVLLPGCSKKGSYWANYNFLPKEDKAFSDDNYDWLWFTVDSSGLTAKYVYFNAGQDSPNGEFTYLGMSFGWATESGEITSNDYEVIYQANYATDNNKGMWFDLPSE